MEEIDTNCRCSTICPVCDGCKMINVPRGCEACSCPAAPDKIDLCSGDQAVLTSILRWYTHICNLHAMNSSINVRTEDIVDLSKCMGMGTAGAYKNGYGSVMGVPVRWQVSYAGFNDTDQYLSFNSTDEPGYYRAILTQNGIMGAPGITLLFRNEKERDRVLGSTPCLN